MSSENTLKFYQVSLLWLIVGDAEESADTEDVLARNGDDAVAFARGKLVNYIETETKDKLSDILYIRLSECRLINEVSVDCVTVGAKDLINEPIGGQAIK